MPCGFDATNPPEPACRLKNRKIVLRLLGRKRKKKNLENQPTLMGSYFSLFLFWRGVLSLFALLSHSLLLYFLVGMRGQRWRPSDQATGCRFFFFFFFHWACLRLAVRIFSLALTVALSPGSACARTRQYPQCWSRCAKSFFFFFPNTRKMYIHSGVVLVTRGVLSPSQLFSLLTSRLSTQKSLTPK